MNKATTNRDSSHAVRPHLVYRFSLRILSATAFPAIREYALTSLRVVFGLMVFLIHGVHKVVDVVTFLRSGLTSKFLEEVAAMGVPAPVVAATLAAVAQLVGGLLLAAGFCTRVAAAVLTFALLGAVAQNLSTGRDPQLAILYTLVAATFAAAGGGPHSLDAEVWDRRVNRSVLADSEEE